jgi:cyclic dehypoxanthinyl futalosine synthase
MRDQKNTPTQVTYLVDRNINYTNVCSTACSFCAFYRPDSTRADAYVLSRDELATKINAAVTAGASRILLQGGHNAELSYDYYIDLVGWITKNFDIEVDAFSPPEIDQISKISGKNYSTVLGELQDAGMSGLPGGGAEILDDTVRRRISPRKASANTWIKIMEAAHCIGLTTTATMVIGFGESIKQRLNHMQRLRDLQDRSLDRGLKGFTAFISWTAHLNEATALGRSIHSQDLGASATEYLRNVAVARLFLDNIQHHQASWPSLGPAVAQIALHFGCDDFGSTMLEENVVSQAGAHNEKWSLSSAEIEDHIKKAGFLPVRRDAAYSMLD